MPWLFTAHLLTPASLSRREDSISISWMMLFYQPVCVLNNGALRQAIVSYSQCQKYVNTLKNLEFCLEFCRSHIPAGLVNIGLIVESWGVSEFRRDV